MLLNINNLDWDFAQGLVQDRRTLTQEVRRVAQGSFLAGFGLSRAALPSAVAFSPKKLRGAALTGAYSAESAHALLDGLFSGRVHTTRFQVRGGRLMSA